MASMAAPLACNGTEGRHQSSGFSKPISTSIASMTRTRPISMNGSTELPARTSSILRRIKSATYGRPSRHDATDTPRHMEKRGSG